MLDEKFEKDEIVLVDYSSYGIMRYKQGTVIKVTKAGNIKVLIDGKEKYDLFNSRGKIRGNTSWNSTYIRKFSQERWDKYLAQQEKSRIIVKISNIRFSDFDISNLWEIEKIIDKCMERKTNDQ